MGEAENHLINEPVLANCPGHRDHLRIRRDLIQEVLRVKLVDLFSAIATDHHRHLVDQRVRRHGDDGLIGAVRGKLRAQMLVPYVIKVLLSGRQGCLSRHNLARSLKFRH